MKHEALAYFERFSTVSMLAMKRATEVECNAQVPSLVQFLHPTGIWSTPNSVDDTTIVISVDFLPLVTRSNRKTALWCDIIRVLPR
jgi:hypothetical protein